MGPFAEAVRATFQPCTFLLIVPAVAASQIAGNRWRALVAILAASVVGGWLVAANWFVLDGFVLRLSAIAAGVAMAAVTLSAARDRVPALARDVVIAGVAGFVTLLATMWWRPCVGDELGAILTGARDGLVGQLVPMALYMLGAMLPVAIVVFAHHTIEPPERATRIVSWLALGVGLVVVGVLVAGQHDRVVVTLTRWTIE